jgi:hypothetical protein
MGDVGGFERDGRVARPVEALRTFLANAQAPGRIISGGEEKDGEMLGLGGGGRGRSGGRRRGFFGRGRCLRRGAGYGQDHGDGDQDDGSSFQQHAL